MAVSRHAIWLSLIAAFGVPARAEDPSFFVQVAEEHPEEAAQVAPDVSQPAPQPYVSPYAGNLWERPFLLGDLGGHRDELVSNGYTLNLSTTQIFQGVAAGGIRQKFGYVGRNDYLLNVNGEKAGLWQGLFIDLHGETRYGEAVNADTGAILPVNTASLFPLPSNSPTALTGVKITQALSEHCLVFAGKINTLDALVQPYAAGRGVDAFMNMALAFPVGVARQVPYSALGGGFAVLREMQPMFTFMVLDTKSTPTTTGFESFFTNGSTLIARLETPVTLLDRPGHQAIWGAYSSGTYNALSDTPYFDPSQGLVIPTTPQQGSWSIYWSADQALFVDPGNPKRSWGLFSNLGLADDSPSPIRWAANVGIGGSSPLVSRPLDTFGIGYAYTGYSGPVHNFAPIALPLRNDQVVELFYNYAVTPWFRLTPDLQILVPARERTLPPGAQGIDTAVVFGLRAKIDF